MISMQGFYTFIEYVPWSTSLGVRPLEYVPWSTSLGVRPFGRPEERLKVTPQRNASLGRIKERIKERPKEETYCPCQDEFFNPFPLYILRVFL
jgi:hypothetical protein